MSKNTFFQKGFASLLVCIVFLACLLVVSVSLANFSYESRQAGFATENKKQSQHMAESCSSYAQAQLESDLSYIPKAGGEALFFDGLSCKICDVSGNGQLKTISTRALVRASTTNLFTTYTVQNHKLTKFAVEESVAYSGNLCQLP
jgi:hypothetical protein